MEEIYPERRSSHTMSAAYCGLDVHKELTYATVLDQTGQVVTQRIMRNEEVPARAGMLIPDIKKLE